MFKALLATKTFYFFVQFTILVPTIPISKSAAVFKQMNIKIVIVTSFAHTLQNNIKINKLRGIIWGDIRHTRTKTYVHKILERKPER
jgi:transcription elongation factor